MRTVLFPYIHNSGRSQMAEAFFNQLAKLTSYYSIKDDLTNAGATWVYAPVVRDGKLITFRQREGLPYFCREIISALSF